MSKNKQVLHKDIALFKQTWKGDEAAELKMNRMSIDRLCKLVACFCLLFW